MAPANSITMSKFLTVIAEARIEMCSKSDAQKKQLSESFLYWRADLFVQAVTSERIVSSLS